MWTAIPISGGNLAYPPSPLHSAAPANSFSISELVPATLVQDIELGVKMDLAFGATNFVPGDIFTFNGLGPGMFEIDVRHTNTNEVINYGNPKILI